MALFDRNQRQRSPLCSTATFVAFATLCLLGLWVASSPEAVPAAMSLASAEKAAARADVKEEDSSIDATNTVKQGIANVVAETAAAAAAGDAAKGDQTFDDENGRTEGGELVKPGSGGGDTDAAAGDTGTGREGVAQA